ncbi:hypothetical protein PC121_g15572 [Phytophthora cactorum]|nr:hypothetical protein PC120_g18133 [Phytophthora cactorum]KAG3055810.1 hypothetical protein PC121_g15572 [Phytophthora cactorum]KAG4051616.1 hypothetical protein PC123_g13188 [Phytophthora cactorum]
MVLDIMSGSTQYSAIDLMDGFYQILMREDDVPLTAVSSPSGMLWEWLVMPQGLKNTPATFNRMVSNLLRPFRSFAPSYFDDIFIHNRAEGGMTDVAAHLQQLRQVFQVMRDNQLYANLKKCIFCAPKIPVLGSYVSKNGVRANPDKIEAICAWPTPGPVTTPAMAGSRDVSPQLLEELRVDCASVVAATQGRRHVVVAPGTPGCFRHGEDLLIHRARLDAA